jgi:DNA-binding MarR family transcriptional regulator
LSENNRRAKYYSLTAEGRRQLGSETRAWTAYAEAVFKVIHSNETLV